MRLVCGIWCFSTLKILVSNDSEVNLGFFRIHSLCLSALQGSLLAVPTFFSGARDCLLPSRPAFSCGSLAACSLGSAHRPPRLHVRLFTIPSPSAVLHVRLLPFFPCHTGRAPSPQMSRAAIASGGPTPSHGMEGGVLEVPRVCFGLRKGLRVLLSQ